MHEAQTNPRPKDEAEIVCRMAFDPNRLAEAVQALAEQDVMVLGYTFEPHEDRGQARFRTTEATNALLALEGIGLEPSIHGEG